MSNWTYNTAFIKGSEKQVIDFFKKADTKIETLQDIIDNASSLSMRSWLPMPQTFDDWDTTNSKLVLQNFIVNASRYSERIAERLGIKIDTEKLGEHWVCKELDEFLFGEYRKRKEQAQKRNEKKGKKTDDTYYYKKYVDSKVKTIEPLIADLYAEYSNGYDNAVKEQKEKFGCVGWYDYNCQTLGTKWNAFIDNAEIETDLVGGLVQVTLRLDTAWGAPIAWLNTLQEQEKDLTFGIYATEESRAFALGFIPKNDYWEEDCDLCEELEDNDFEYGTDEWEEKYLENEEKICAREELVYDNFVKEFYS